MALQTRNRAGRADLRGLWIARGPGTQAQKPGADGPARWLLSMMTGLPEDRGCVTRRMLCAHLRARGASQSLFR